MLTTLMLRLRKSIEQTTCEWLFFGWIVLGLIVLCLPLLVGCNAGMDSANGANPAIPGNGNVDGHGSKHDPSVSPSPTGFSYSGDQGASAPAAQKVTISNSATGTLGWDVDTIAAWLSAPPVSATDTASSPELEDISELTAEADSATIPDVGVDATYTPEFSPEDLTISTSPPELPAEASIAPDALVWDPALNPDTVQN